jgi:serine protease Do
VCVIAAAAAATTFAGRALAQETQPTVPVVTYGETVTGVLDSADNVLSDGSFFKPYVLTGSEGDEVSLFLSSTDFDSALLLFKEDSAETLIATDANSGGNCDAYLTTTLPDSGTYAVVVNAAETGERGQFQLTVLQGTQPPMSDAPCQGYTGVVGSVAVGDSLSGTLGAGDRMMRDSTLFQVILLDNLTSGPFTVDLVSADFDAALIIVRGLREIVTFDDDSGPGGCNARIPFGPEDTGPYRLVVMSRSKGRGGSYVLRVSPGLSPLIAGTVCQMTP